MHLALRTPEGGELWIGGLNAGGNAELLRVNGISAVLCAGSNVSAARAAFIKNIGTFDGTGVCRGSIKWATVLSVLRTVAKELAAGGRVLVVCKNGAHRSALWLALLLCVLCGLLPAEAMQHIRRVREICDFDTYHPGHHRFQSHWEAPVRTPAQFLEAKADDLMTAHKELAEERSVFRLNTLLSPAEFTQLVVNRGGSLPDRAWAEHRSQFRLHAMCN